MKKNKKLILSIIVILLCIICISIYLVNNGTKSTSEITKSSEKLGIDESGIDWSEYDSYDITLGSGNVNITKAGVYNINGTLNSGSIIIDTSDNVKLLLNGVTITNNDPAIYVKSSKNTYIEIKNENNLTCKASDTLDSCIYSTDDLFIYGDGSLTIESNKDGIASKDDLTILSGTYTINASEEGIKGRDSITIENGKFTINSKNGIKTTNEEKGELIINNGEFKIVSESDSIESITNLTINDGTFDITTGSTNSDSSMKGIKSANELVINNGKFKINSIDDAIHSNKNITINNGTIEISTSDDGIHSDNNLNIKSGTINITKSHEGLEAYNITIDGGNISIVADDDGVNIGGGNDSSGDEFSDNGGKLTINNGEIYVNSKGDGLDSNGSIYMNGGTVHVDGPVDNGNGSLDYNGEFKITGGELIAVGSSGMAQNVSSSSTQNTIMVNLDSQTSGDITLGDISYSPSKNYQSILISSPNLKTNTDYTLTAGTQTKTISLTSTITTIGGNNMMGGGMNNMQGQRGNIQGGIGGR